MPFKCKFCGRQFCYNHRLPEVHNCAELASYKEKVRESGKFEYLSGLPIKKQKKPLFGPLTGIFSVITNNYSLTILFIATFAFFFDILFPGSTSNLELYPTRILSQPWTLITHIFLHSGPLHLLFNMMFLFFFGPELERRIGGKRFLIVFFVSGIIAAIGYSLWSVFVLNSPTPAVGASGALFGIFACLAVLAPHIEVYIYFIPMKITYALIFFAMFDLLFIGSGDAIARSAHLSGLVAGLLFGRHIKQTGQFIHD
ncbi:MAG: rhomboid family intramembrane serine protease [Candidatus Methanoperedens sp.]|nr:rhomboid family intramembrane serine protease [Candidatus Methanoperedens sp.]